MKLTEMKSETLVDMVYSSKSSIGRRRKILIKEPVKGSATLVRAWDIEDGYAIKNFCDLHVDEICGIISPKDARELGYCVDEEEDNNDINYSKDGKSLMINGNIIISYLKKDSLRLHGPFLLNMTQVDQLTEFLVDWLQYGTFSSTVSP